MIKKFFFVIFFIFILSLLFCDDLTNKDFKTIKKGNFSFSWRINEKYLDLKITAETTGWLAIGIDPINKMKDANFIIGYVSDGKAFISDEYGTSAVSHKPDEKLGGKNDIINLSGVEKDNKTTLSFSIPLDSGDKFDKKITKGKHLIILSSSSKDDFTTKHSKKISFEIEIK